jgi:hypothetical protein
MQDSLSQEAAKGFVDAVAFLKSVFNGTDL